MSNVNLDNLTQARGFIQNITTRSNDQFSTTFFSLRVRRNYQNKNDEGEKVYQFDTINCRVRGNTEKYLLNHLVEGQAIRVIGALESFVQLVIGGELKPYSEELKDQGKKVFRHVLAVDTIKAEESADRANKRMDSFKNEREKNQSNPTHFEQPVQQPPTSQEKQKEPAVEKELDQNDFSGDDAFDDYFPLPE